MRVLVTGAAGFIGSAVSTALRGRGHEVIGVDALILQAHPAGAELSRDVQRVDVRDPQALGEALTAVDVVCHQAAMVGAGLTASDLPGYAAHNDLGTAVLLAAMAERDVGRLVLASSMVVYGEGRCACTDHGEQVPTHRRTADLEAGRFDHLCSTCRQPLNWQPVDESAPLEPRSGYAASKVAQEHYAAAWASQAGGCAIALRYHNVYGPGMPRDTPYSGVAAIFRSQLESGSVPRVFEDGGQMRDFVHVDDVARANVLAVDAIEAVRAGDLVAYNVCSGTPISILEVARLLSAASPGSAPPVVTGDYRAGDVRHIVASPERAAIGLGFRAEVTPAVGMRAFATAPLRASVTNR